MIDDEDEDEDEDEDFRAEAVEIRRRWAESNEGAEGEDGGCKMRQI